MLEELMRHAITKFGAPLAELKYETIRGRRKTNRKLKCTHRGPLSLMHEVEAHLLKVILLRGVMRQPVSCGEGLELADLIKEDTVTQLQMIQWKQLHLGKSFREKSAAILGQKDWGEICKGHSREIKSKKAVRYDSKREDWCTLPDFERMYDGMYDAMTKWGVCNFFGT
jgi:hypothetical protein